MTQALSLIQILAITMYGEASILQNAEAAMAVGHVFMNRLDKDDKAFGNTPLEVARGFNAYATTSPNDIPEGYYEMASSVLSRGADPTGLCMYIVSRQDIIKTFSDNNATVAARLMMYADWRSSSRIINGKTYQLYAFKKFPTSDNYPDTLRVFNKLEMLEQ